MESRSMGGQYRRPEGHVLDARRGRARLAVLAAVLCFLPGGTALAQHHFYNVPAAVPVSEVAQLETERRQLFQKILDDPADLDAGFAYAVASTRLGDYEAAIATYERMLIVRPATPRLQLELAALYFRLGAYPRARQLFDRVLALPETPDPVRRRIAGYMAVIEGERKQRGGFSGMLSIGARAESNANGAPDRDSISLNGRDFELAPDSRAASDSSLQLGALLRYRQPLSKQGDVLDVSLAAASSRYRDLGELGSDGLELRLGPDISLNRWGWRDARIAVAGLLGQTWLDGTRYMHSGGLAVAFRKPIGRESLLAANVDWRDERYTPAAEMASAKAYSGDRYRASVSYSRQLADDWQLLLNPGVERRKAQVAFNSYWEPRFNVGVNYRYPALLGKRSQPWMLAVTAQAARRRNDVPMTVVSRDTRQRGNELVLQAMQTIPLRSGTDLQLYAGYRRLHSNYALREYNNRFAGFSVIQAF
ncbi:MAG: tetratricopeptide repeat protein [Stenotrophomonas sp.]